MLPSPGLILTLVGMYGLMFLTYKTANKPTGLSPHSPLPVFWVISFDQFWNASVSAGMGDVIAMALGGTALVFFCCSAYVLTTRKDMSFLGGMLMAGIVVVLIGMVANIFLQLPALHLAISAVFILISSGAILFEPATSFMAVKRTIFVPRLACMFRCKNIFVSLLSILGFASRD
ncbi:Bax inhibitor-1 family protein [Escherichia coli]